MACYNAEPVQADELRKFADAGLDVGAGRERLNSALVEISGKHFDHVTGTDSVHWLIFACLSLTAWGKGIRDILEVGTFRGKTTLLLSKLFPDALVVTYDLPADDPVMRQTYRRDDPTRLSEHVQRRSANIVAARAQFIEANSFFLPVRTPGPYDLVWVDGAHTYPEIAWDICNAYNCCRPGGIVMCDDVFMHPGGGDGIYGNGDSYEVLRYLEHRFAIPAQYFLKRENPEWSAYPRDRKFVAVLRKAAG